MRDDAQTADDWCLIGTDKAGNVSLTSRGAGGLKEVAAGFEDDKARGCGLVAHGRVGCVRHTWVGRVCCVDATSMRAWRIKRSSWARCRERLLLLRCCACAGGVLEGQWSTGAAAASVSARFCGLDLPRRRSRLLTCCPTQVQFAFVRLARTDDGGDSKRVKFVLLSWTGEAAGVLVKGRVGSQKSARWLEAKQAAASGAAD